VVRRDTPGIQFSRNEGKEILKFDGREEIKPCTACTYRV
jgi:hypothetical protein